MIIINGFLWRYELLLYQVLKNWFQVQNLHMAFLSHSLNFFLKITYYQLRILRIVQFISNLYKDDSFNSCYFFLKSVQFYILSLQNIHISIVTSWSVTFLLLILGRFLLNKNKSMFILCIQNFRHFWIILLFIKRNVTVLLLIM